MEEWKEYKIGDLCNISSSKRIFAKEYQEYGVPFFRGKEIIEKQKGANVSNELFISEERYAEIKNKYGVPQCGDMLLTSVGTLGVPYIVKEEKFYFKDGNLTWFYNFNGLNSKYLYYWFLSPIGKYSVDSKAIGSTQKALTIDCLSKFDICLPSINTQERIVSILSSLDDKIEVNRRINEQLEELAQALFKSWFVDFEPFKDGEFVESELGMIPEGWKIVDLKEFCIEIVRGYTPKYAEFSDYPILNQKVNKGDKLEKQYYKYNKNDDSVPLNKMAQRGDVYLNSLGQGTLGRIHLYKDELSNVIVDQFITILRTDSFIKSAYLASILKSPIYQNEIESRITGSTGMWVLTINNIRNIKIVQPLNSLWQQLENIIEPIYRQIAINEKENEHLTNLRDTLLPKLMSGEIDVNEVEI